MPRYYIHEYYLTHTLLSVVGFGLYYTGLTWGIEHLSEIGEYLRLSLEIMGLIIGASVLGYLNAKGAAKHPVKVHYLHIFLSLLILMASILVVQARYWSIALESLTCFIVLQSGVFLYKKTKLKQIILR